jgi:hypothetical protein
MSSKELKSHLLKHDGIFAGVEYKPVMCSSRTQQNMQKA